MKVSHTTLLTRQTEPQSQSPSQTKESHATPCLNGQFSQRETRERSEAPHTKQSHLKHGFIDAETGSTTDKLRSQFVKPGFIDIRYTAPVGTVAKLPSYEQFSHRKRKPRARTALVRLPGASGNMRVGVKPSQPH